MPRFLTSLAAALALLIPAAAANAQAYQCRMPQVSSVPKVTPNTSRRELPVTGYTMALSWRIGGCDRRLETS